MHNESKLSNGGRTISWLFMLFITLLPWMVSGRGGLDQLKQAASTIGSMSFIAHYTYQFGGSKSKMQLCQRKTARGRYEFRKQIEVSEDSITITNVFLSNASGYWELLGDKALRINFMPLKPRSPLFGLVGHSLSFSEKATYKTHMRRVQGRKLIVVSQTPGGVAQGILNRRVGIVEEDFAIDPDTHIIYQFDSKLKNGSIARISITHLQSFHTLPDEDFEIPANITRVLCTNAMQYSQIVASIVNNSVNTPAVKKWMNHEHAKADLIRDVMLVILLTPVCIIIWFFIHRLFKRHKMANTL